MREEVTPEPPEPTNLGTLLAELVAEMRDLSLPASLGRIADIEVRSARFGLRRALRNLIANTASHGGGPEVALERQEDEAVITISDHGPGILEGLLAKAFEPFFRVDSARREGWSARGFAARMRETAEIPMPASAPSPRDRQPSVLTIAGTDPIGGAGIAADLKTFAAHGIHGAAVVTAVVAQNSLGVTASAPVAPDLVAAQIDAAFADLEITAVKIGMLATAAIAETVAERVSYHRARNIVLDPVMMSSSGHALLSPEGVAVLRQKLWPLAHVATPNLPEAAALLSNASAHDRQEMAQSVAALRPLGADWLLLKGGHLPGEDSSDLLSGPGQDIWIEGPRLASPNSRGTGCTLSSAIAANLVTQATPEAVRAAKSYMTIALQAAATRNLTRGSGPLHHLHGYDHLRASQPR